MGKLAACVRILVLAIALAGGCTVGQAQEFPTRPISIVVPYATGGPYDITARQIADQMRLKLGKPVIVEPKPGGASLVATRYVQAAPADGHTVLLQTGGLAVNTLVFKDVGYTLSDFVPVSSIATNAYVLFVNQKVPASNLKDLIAYARANQETLNIGDFGATGTIQLLTSQLMEGMNLTRVSYKGASEMILALLANDIQMAFLGVGPGQPYLESKQLKAIGISSNERSATFPDILTFKEQGIPVHSGVSYLAFFVRKGTPDSVVKVLRDATDEIVRSREYRDRILPLGLEPWTISSAELAREVEDDYLAWKKRLAEDPSLNPNTAK